MRTCRHRRRCSSSKRYVALRLFALAAALLRVTLDRCVAPAATIAFCSSSYRYDVRRARRDGFVALVTVPEVGSLAPVRACYPLHRHILKTKACTREL